ncbi:MAG TPA: hypothetical protein PK504_12940 [Ferruginibacter sp.]|nr:hypothetical protein [Ferruginibacter sp.]HRE64396.1 hypothetical protein [Ferruginibacter sp.]
MIKRLTIVIVFSLVNTLLVAQKKDWKTIELAEGLASIELPLTFNLPMELPVIIKDSTPVSKHWIIINKKNALVRLAFEYPTDAGYIKITDNDIPEWADKQLTALKKSTAFSYIDDGIYLQNWKNISYIKYYINQDDGSNTFNMLFFTNIGDRLIQFTFSCPAKLRKKWEAVADSIANSLRVKD